jgi:hypothetical protein
VFAPQRILFVESSTTGRCARSYGVGLQQHQPPPNPVLLSHGGLVLQVHDPTLGAPPVVLLEEGGNYVVMISLFGLEPSLIETRVGLYTLLLAPVLRPTAMYLQSALMAPPHRHAEVQQLTLIVPPTHFFNQDLGSTQGGVWSIVLTPRPAQRPKPIPLRGGATPT